MTVSRIAVIRRYVLALSIAAIANVPASFADPVAVGLLDGPVDLGHPWLVPSIELDWMRSLATSPRDFVSELPGPLSWLEFNNRALERLSLQFSSQENTELVKGLNANALYAALGKGADEQATNAYEFAFRVRVSPKFREKAQSFGFYLHGTHVAGLITARDPEIRILSYPYLSGVNHVGRALHEKILSFDPERARAEYRAELETVMAGFKQAGVRIVNMSFAQDAKTTRKNVHHRLGFWRRLLLTGQWQSYADRAAAIAAQEFRQVIQDNPEIVFVIAAGNDGDPMSTPDDSLSGIRLPNVVRVAGTNASGTRRASFSSFSVEDVEVASPAEALQSARVGGGTIHLSGTSMAAPLVTHRLALIFKSNSDLTAAQAVDQLLHFYALAKPDLVACVKNGRFLPPCAPLTRIKVVMTVQREKFERERASLSLSEDEMLVRIFAERLKGDSVIATRLMSGSLILTLVWTSDPAAPTLRVQEVTSGRGSKLGWPIGFTCDTALRGPALTF